MNPIIYVLITKVNMVLKAIGSHLIQPEFGSSVRGQLILSPSTKENYSTNDQLFSSSKIGKRISNSFEGKCLIAQ